jgi:site-specific recombinase XerC
MPRPSSADTTYLEKKNGKWRVTLAVPRALHKKLGTRLKRPLHTDSLAVANRLKWQAVSELRAEIAHAQTKGGKGALVREAIELAAYRGRAANPEELANVEDAITFRADEITGPPQSEEHIPGVGPVYQYDPQRQRQAEAFVAVARGNATPIELHHDQYLSQATTKPRTKADDKRAIKFLLAWCDKNRVTPALQAITPRIATRFMDELATVAGGQDPVTLQKYLSRLSQYWKWLYKREHVETNVWQGLKLSAPETPHDHLERPFTREEMIALLTGPASPAMHDLMRVAALTGARLDAIADLHVKDCRKSDRVFLFKPQKRESGQRAVPIHSALASIVRRRTATKGPEDDLFPEWPPPKKSASMRERSFKASNAFTEYRRSVGVDDVVPGKRRSLVNFHSFRRWFITEAERADVPESIIAAVVGHKRQGMTLGKYSAGPKLEQARRCVEAVKLPRTATGTKHRLHRKTHRT